MQTSLPTKECNHDLNTLPSYCPFKSHTIASKKGLEDFITPVAFISVFALLLLPYERINGDPVPTVIFTNRPSYFHAFVLGLNFAFCGGVMAISLRQLSPRFASFCRCICALSTLLATGIFVSLAVPWAADAFLPHDSSPAVAAA